MSKIYGVTVGTPINPARIERDIKPVKTVNGRFPDENGNVVVGGGGGSYILTDEDKAEIVQDVLASLPYYNGDVTPYYEGEVTITNGGEN